MPVVKTDELKPGVYHPDNLQIYNGLDTCITTEVFEELQAVLGVSLDDSPTNSSGPAAQMYAFERALQGPVLEIMLRGFAVDELERRAGVEKLRQVEDQLRQVLDQFALVVWDKPLNPRSPKQLLEFFYGAMRLPEQWKSVKGVRKLSTDRESLEKLEVYFYARPIIATILAIRDTAKRREVLETEVDPDGRMRTSYNIAGTETWRFSSSSSAFGTGSNLQNITPELRHIFIADLG